MVDGDRSGPGIGEFVPSSTIQHRLVARPDRLSLAAETLVRLESLIEHALSLSQAVRRYQNPAIAEVLESEISAAGASREWLRRHVMELASIREQELVILRIH